MTKNLGLRAFLKNIIFGMLKLVELKQNSYEFCQTLLNTNEWRRRDSDFINGLFACCVIHDLPGKMKLHKIDRSSQDNNFSIDALVLK